MRIVLASLSLLLLLSCSEKTYQYIQVEQKEGLFGDLKTKEKEPEEIVAGSDSAAYLEAFEKFAIAEKVHHDMVNAYGKTYTKPKYFKLLNEDGKNIANTTRFKDMDSLKQEIVYIVSLTSSPEPRSKPGKMNEQELGDKWPLIVPDGQVMCLEGMFVVFKCSQGIFAVNGTARSFQKEKGWKDIDEIWKDHPEDPSRKIPISPILNRGLELCQ